MAYKYFCVLWLLNVVFSGNASDERDLKIRFDADLYSSEHFNISHCRTRKPYYNYVKGMNISVELYYKSDFNVTALDSCMFGNTKMVHRYWSVRRAGHIQYIYVKFTLPEMRTKLFAPSLTCIMKLDSNTSIPTSQLRCQTHFTQKEYEHYVTYHSGDIEASVSADLNEVYVIHELFLHKNSSLLLKCQTAGKSYEHSIVLKDKSGKTGTVGISTTRFTIDDRTAHISEYGCLERYKYDTTDTHQATLWLHYVDNKPREDDHRADEDDEVNSNDIGWLKIMLITSGCFVAVVLLVTSVSVFCRRGKTEGIINDQDDSRDSGVHEEIENNRRRRITLSLAPSPPSPPPPYLLFTLPVEEIPHKDDTSPPSYAEAVSQRNFVSPADHLLAVDP